MSITIKQPVWAFISLFTNCLLLFALVLVVGKQQGNNRFLGTMTAVSDRTPSKNQAINTLASMGKRHKLNYQQWVDILKQEARVAAEKKPSNLSILAGDSLSLWFPPELLPEEKHWLNQGISGEKSQGLLKRLNLFDKTQPKAIFVMIGINDLIAGVSDRKILENQEKIVDYLQNTHPKTEIIVQSILPHGSRQATWEGKDKLLQTPNSRIRKLNKKLLAIAKKRGVKFLNLYPLFADSQGNLRLELSTDGLHLNSQGYIVWRTALQLYTQMELGNRKKE
ncbi:MAG: SGNH/GDSL hydrolase family protein [Mastigocoleus sp. MO_167.B18]|nr:SGNH/GDSL hydrolase family protein [Mastigocoleus sp. MO_167.B18]